MRKPPRSHVYHLNTARLLILPAVWLGVMALLLVPLLFSSPPTTAAGADADAGLWFGTAAFTLILLPFMGIVWQSRLVLTPEGIAHHQFGYTVRSAWDNVVALDLRTGREGLVLAQPGTRSRLLRWSTQVLAGAAPGPVEGLVGDPHALAQGRLIFLAPFMQHWRRGPLRDDLQRWAPHLFVAGPAPTQRDAAPAA
jgi:hypothetical protein